MTEGLPLGLALAPPPAAQRGLAQAVLPAALRDLDVTSGCAAGYDGWLTGGTA